MNKVPYTDEKLWQRFVKTYTADQLICKLKKLTGRLAVTCY